MTAPKFATLESRFKLLQAILKEMKVEPRRWEFVVGRMGPGYSLKACKTCYNKILKDDTLEEACLERLAPQESHDTLEEESFERIVQAYHSELETDDSDVDSSHENAKRVDTPPATKAVFITSQRSVGNKARTVSTRSPSGCQFKPLLPQKEAYQNAQSKRRSLDEVEDQGYLEGPHQIRLESPKKRQKEATVSNVASNSHPPALRTSEENRPPWTETTKTTDTWQNDHRHHMLPPRHAAPQQTPTAPRAMRFSERELMDLKRAESKRQRQRKARERKRANEPLVPQHGREVPGLEFKHVPDHDKMNVDDQPRHATEVKNTHPSVTIKSEPAPYSSNPTESCSSNSNEKISTKIDIDPQAWSFLVANGEANLNRFRAGLKARVTLKRGSEGRKVWLEILGKRDRVALAEKRAEDMDSSWRAQAHQT